MNNTVKIISVLSGKGGVGKSVLSFNMAERLSALGVRTLLVDADINFGNLHIMANVNAEYGLSQFINKTLSLKEAVTKLNRNLDLLASSGGIIEYDNDDVKTTASYIKSLRNQAVNYDVVIIDHGSGISKNATIIAHASELALLVLVPELTSISDCYGLYKHLKSTDRFLNCQMVINRVMTVDETDYLFNKFCAVSERFIGSVPEIFGNVPESEIFRKALASQTTIAGLDIKSPAVQAVTRLAKQACRQLGIAVETAKINNTEIINKTTALADIKE